MSVATYLLEGGEGANILPAILLSQREYLWPPSGKGMNKGMNKGMKRREN
jgi:hypothetical protein